VQSFQIPCRIIRTAGTSVGSHLFRSSIRGVVMVRMRFRFRRCSSVDRFIVADGLGVVIAFIVMMVVVVMMTSQKERNERI
jgi:hypothetical protein